MIRPLWIEIDLAVLEKNFKAVRSRVAKSVKIVATVKQSAYGHGLIPVARTLSGLGVDCFGVGSMEEAVKLRRHKLKEPIIVLSPVFPKYSSYFIKYGVIPTVSGLVFAKELNRRAKKKIPVHIKVDTGMGRLGFCGAKAAEFIEEVSQLKKLSLEGIYTHFPAADSDKVFTDYQLEAFNCLLKGLSAKGINFKFIHSANSIGILKYRRAHFNMVRPGLILYGIDPDSVGNRHACSLQPALSFKSKVIFIKKIAKGTTVGYGRAWTAPKDTRIATVAVGYADGYPWALSNRSKVIIGDKFFRIAGRVCMDHIMVDVGRNSNISVGDEVILIGASKNCRITAQDLADWAQTISYEIVSRLPAKIPRIYIQ